MDLELTQLLDDEKANSDNDESTQVGILRVGSTEYSIVKGCTRIGRNPALCKIVVNEPTVSKVHAEIQAACEMSFISDLRSANGTKMNNVPLNPFFCYTINDGDTIYFGSVKAIFTTSKSSQRNDVILPETPIPSRKLSEKITPGLGNDANFLFSDDSVVPGTERKGKKTSSLQEPTVPVNPRKCGNKISISPVVPSASEKSQKNGAATKSWDAVDAGDAHDPKTQQFDKRSFVSQSRASMKPRLEKFESDFVDTDISEMETQVLPRTMENDTSGSSRRGHDSTNIGSPGPPESPNPMDQCCDSDQSLDLLSMCETPPFDYARKMNNTGDSNEREIASKCAASAPEKNSNAKVSPIAMEESVNRIESVRSNNVIADSDDESETDDDMDIAIAEARARGRKAGISVSGPSDVIEDDSATDDGGTVEIFASPLPSKVNEKKMVQEPPDVASVKKCRDVPKYDTDIDLLPTQILDVVTSTPLSRSHKQNMQKSVKNPRLKTEDDLHLAPTQIMSDGVDIADRNARKRSAAACPSLDAEKTGEVKVDRAANLDDTLERNLGEILDEEATDRESTDEPTQLMTQNLVDILRPTQSFNELKPRDFDEEMVDVLRERRNSKKKKISLSATLGFVGGQAVDGGRWRKTVPTATSAMRDDRNEDDEETDVAVGEPRESECLDEDDILFGLPEVKIFGTLSNPGSPALSTASSHSDFVVPSLTESGNSAKAKKTVAVRSTESPDSLKTIQAAKSLELDSPVVSKKSRVARRRVARNLIEDQDSDEAFGYNDLNKIADSLLASDSVDSTRSRKKDNDGAIDELERFSSTRRRPRHVRNTIPPNDADSSRRTRKLPRPPSSLLVSDAKGKRSADGSASIDDESSSDGGSKNSSRLRVTSRSEVASKRSEESQEVETILAATPKENIPTISMKSYAKVSTVNRKRRATMSEKDVTPALPAAAKSRRTIAEGLETRELPKEQHKILITGLNDDYSHIVKRLGGSLVFEPAKATVLITDKVRRTYKFLCAVAHGLRVVSINWLRESDKAARFLDCNDFILSDPEAERKYRFNLEKSLLTARTIKFLEGYKLIVTPKADLPEIHELKAMIKVCGGQVVTRAPSVRSWTSKTLIISTEEDLAAINALLSKCPKSLKVTAHSTEFILTGILRQEVNLVEHRLDIP